MPATPTPAPYERENGSSALLLLEGMTASVAQEVLDVLNADGLLPSVCHIGAPRRLPHTPTERFARWHHSRRLRQSTDVSQTSPLLTAAVANRQY